MGLFQKLPEDPVEWAGLPSEPLPEESAAQLLADSAPAAEIGLGFGDVGSIIIPVVPETRIDEPEKAPPTEE